MLSFFTNQVYSSQGAAWRAPPKTASGVQVVFSCFGNKPLFPTCFENWQVHVFKIATNLAFQRTIISAVTQYATIQQQLQPQGDCGTSWLSK
jgi:hypothetical protein